jgi:hypothetical protein
MMDPQATLDTMHRLMIRREAALWFSSNRPIHAWRIRQIFREAGWPVPEDIEKYLDGCGDRLLEADLTSPEQVANALLLDPKGRNRKVSCARLIAAENVFALKTMNPDRSLNSIITEVATQLNAEGRRLENGKDAESFVKQAYHDWRRRLLKVQKNR